VNISNSRDEFLISNENGYKTNEEIRKGLNIDATNEKKKEYKENCNDPVQRMEDGR
jgi:hypothetical protein